MSSKVKKISKKPLFIMLGLALSAIILIPMLYSSIYLSAFWDTYGNINKVPVAFVNLDKAASKDGKDYNIGKDVEDNLKDNDKVKWNFVSYEDAKHGVEGSEYYAMIVIPENFSQKLADSTDGKFEKPEVIYEGNKGKNYVFSQISQRVADSIKNNIAGNIQKETSKALVDNLNTIKDSIKDASEGASALKNGTQQLWDGSNRLVDGTIQAKDGSEKLQNGLKDAANGESRLLDGTDALIAGLNAFKNSLTQKNDDVGNLVEGAKNVSTNVSLIADKVDKQMPQKLQNAADGIDDISNAVKYAQGLISIAMNNLKANGNLSDDDKDKIDKANNILKGIEHKNISENIAEPLRGASSTAQSLVNGLPKLKEGTEKVAYGTAQLEQGIADTQSKAAAGVEQLIDGANQLKIGNSSLLNGLNTAAEKTGQLKDGLAQVSSGASNLSDGLNTANDGASQLSDGLQDGYTKINDKIKFTSDDMANFVSEPVVLKDQSINGVEYYGEGLAPYFISLSLWLGAMFINLGLTLIKRIEKIKSKFLDSFTGKFIIGTAIAVIQAMLLSFVLVKGLSIDVVNINYFYLCNIFIAVVFFSIMYGASNLMGIIATPVMFVIFLLQLSSSGGTFPIETAPKFFQVIGQYVPMTYSINALRMVIGGINSYILSKDINILLIFMGLFLASGFILKMLKGYFKSVKNKNSELIANGE